jgi:hypothetical protein
MRLRTSRCRRSTSTTKSPKSRRTAGRSLFIDACRSGGATLPADRSLRAMLAAPNVAVFTSSKAGEKSIERPEWQNGAFTAALREADDDHDGLIRVSDLSAHLSEHVVALTGGKQPRCRHPLRHPDTRLRGEGPVAFVSADTRRRIVLWLALHSATQADRLCLISSPEAPAVLKFLMLLI